MGLSNEQGSRYTVSAIGPPSTYGITFNNVSDLHTQVDLTSKRLSRFAIKFRFNSGVLNALWVSDWRNMVLADRVRHSCSSDSMHKVTFLLDSPHKREVRPLHVGLFTPSVNVDTQLRSGTRKLLQNASNRPLTVFAVPLFRDLSNPGYHLPMTIRQVLDEIALGPQGLYVNCIDIPELDPRRQDFLPAWLR